MFKKLILLPLLLALPATLLAQAAPMCTSVTLCLQESYRQSRPRLPDYIHEKTQECALLQESQGKEAYQKCHAKIVDFSQKALSCNVDVNRLAEAVKYDNKHLQYIIGDNGGEVAVPEDIQKIFINLTQAADKNFKFPLKQPVWKLHAYSSKTANAHAGANGEILISSFFWDSNTKFSLGEIAGILGHEISHVIHRDSLHLGCLAHEWVGSNLPLTIEELTTIFREDSSIGTPGRNQWNEVSQSLELNADQGGKTLLGLAGLDPALMAQALQKLAESTSEGTSGSHPGFISRLQNLK